MNQIFYAVSVILNLLLVCAIAPFIKLLILSWKRKLLSKKGYGYVKIIGNDGSIRTFFQKIDNKLIPKFKEFNFKAIDPTAKVLEDGMATFYYRAQFAEPINFFKPYDVTINLEDPNDSSKTQSHVIQATPFSLGTDSKMIDSLIHSEVQAVDIATEWKRNDMIYKVLIATLIAAAIAALYSFDVANKINALQQAGVLLA